MVDRLLGPDVLPFGQSVADGQDRRSVVVGQNGVEIVDPAFLGPAAEVDRDRGFGAEPGDHFDVQHRLADRIGIVLLVGRQCQDMLDDHFGRGRREAGGLEKELEVRRDVLSSELEDPDLLAGAVSGGELVGVGESWGRNHGR